MRFEVFKSGSTVLSQKWYWRLIASNGEPIASSGEGYYSKDDCIHGIGLVKGTNAMTPVIEI